MSAVAVAQVTKVLLLKSNGFSRLRALCTTGRSGPPPVLRNHTGKVNFAATYRRPTPRYCKSIPHKSVESWWYFGVIWRRICRHLPPSVAICRHCRIIPLGTGRSLFGKTGPGHFRILPTELTRGLILKGFGGKTL